jgi:catechol 2,3-dioxygenase-like lactoylglutathione lyase family enzyme
MNVKTIAHVCLHAKDLNKSLAFYSALDLKPRFRFVDKQGTLKGFYLRISDNNFIEIFERANTTAAAGAIAHFCLQVDDIIACRQKLLDAGIQVTEKKLGADQSYQCWVTDPDGNRIEFHEYTAQSCQKTGKDCVIG